MLKVLIADDEIIVRKTIRRVGAWEECGMEIIGEACNGVETLQLIQEKNPDVLILDMRMPGLSGEEILETLERQGKKMAVVVVSGFDSFTYARKALRYGVVDYILKPIDRVEFQAVLKKISGSLAVPSRQEEGSRHVLEKIKEEIERDYKKDISLKYFANTYYLNKDALSRMFKKRFGTGITEYINQVRLEQAKVYLLLGYPVGTAGELAGYKDVNYFSRIFKKKYQMSPSEFQHKQNP